MTDNVIITQYTVIHPFEIAHRKKHTQLSAGNNETKKVQLPHNSKIICRTFAQSTTIF